MALATLRRLAARLMERLDQAVSEESSLLAELRADPARIFERAGMTADPWQRTLVRSRWRQTLLLCSRQSGKSTTAAALAWKAALLEAPALALLLSPTLRQSGELFRDQVRRLCSALGRPVATAQESALTMELANGSRSVSLPGDEETVRGYSGVRLLVVDEASRVPENLYRSIRPMLAVSLGRLVCLSTPFGKLGWFHDEWHGSGVWERVKITADQCPRIPKALLADEWKALGELWYRQEYFCEFLEIINAVFSHADILAACDDTVRPLFGGGCV